MKQEVLTQLYGPEATSSLQDNNHNLVLHPTNGEDNGHVQDASPLNNSSSTSDQNGKFSSNGKIWLLALTEYNLHIFSSNMETYNTFLSRAIVCWDVSYPF